MITTEPRLAEYQNGNCHVTICADGTKVREWPDGETPTPEFPESIDLKITNKCDKGCAFCHERSVPAGRLADVNRIVEAVDDLPRGVEIAIGGGNPLDHPELGLILYTFWLHGLVSNMTIHGDHVLAGSRRIQQWQWPRRGLVHGVGVSGARACMVLQANNLLPNNAVCHVIAGVDDPLDAIKLRSLGCNVLVLGYKQYGRGEKHFGKQVTANMGRWRYFIGALLGRAGGILSFDNLAIDQLKIQDLVSSEMWRERYMGDDGKFTMYFDAVESQYAASSTSERRDAGSMTLRQMFEAINVKGETRALAQWQSTSTGQAGETAGSIPAMPNGCHRTGSDLEPRG